MSKRIVLLALGLAACHPQRSAPLTPRAPTSAHSPTSTATPPIEPPALAPAPGIAKLVRPGATVFLDHTGTRALQLPDDLASGGLAVRVLATVGDEVEVETDAEAACLLQPLHAMRLRIFVARADLRDPPAPCVLPREWLAGGGVLTEPPPPHATRILRSGTEVFWRDDTPAGTVARDLTFVAPPSVIGARTCFPFALAPGDELMLCFASHSIAEVRPERPAPTAALRGDPTEGLGNAGLGGGLPINEGVGPIGRVVRDREASSTPRSQVRFAKPRVVGPLAIDIVRRIARAHVGELRSCYDAALVRDPQAHGELEIAFTITAAGEVDDAMPKSSTLPDTELLTCIVERVNRWKFPEPRGNSRVKVEYPFVLALE